MGFCPSIRQKKAVTKLVIFALVSWGAAQVWAQTDDSSSRQPVPVLVGFDNSSVPADPYNPDASEDRMLTPPPVSGQTYPVMLASQERANFLRGGLSFTSAYTDNVVGSTAGHPVSDITYYIAPLISLDETTPRLHYLLTYAPGFTFYQRNGSLNEAAHNASIEFEYRLSPHVTLSAHDGFQKSSNIFDQPLDFSAGGTVSGGTQSANFSVIAPVASRLSNFGNVGLSYQFQLNDMVGASGTFSTLHYLDPSQVPGLYDSSSQAGLAFYSHRFARGQYLGVTYEYQRLLAYPNTGVSKTQTQAVLFFYTYSPTRRFSMSMFGGPQYSETVEPPTSGLQSPNPELRSWTPAAGASLNWQARLTSFALSYSHVITGGGGLVGAAQQDSATLTARQQITRTLNASVAGGYSQNDVIGSALLGVTDGHTVFGTASLQQSLGQHLSVQLGYTRLHQNYSDIAVISAMPNTNREFVSISYQFSRPLGR
jgi:hypothetical protein